MSDQLADGRRFRILTVVDDCTRECLALVAYTSFSGILVARELDRLMVERGKRAASARPFRAGRFAAKRAAPPQLSIDSR